MVDLWVVRSHRPDETCFGLLLGLPRARLVVVAGVGWDADHPFRPWPRLTTEPTPKGHPGWCLSCLGLFVNVRRFRAR